MNANRDSHDHVLWAFDYLIVYLKQVTLLKSLEAKVVIVEVTLVVDGSIETFVVLLNNLVNVISNEAGVLSIVTLVVV